MDDGARIPLVALQTAVRADVDAREHNDIARKREWVRQNYENSPRHTIEEEHVPYIQELKKSQKEMRRAAGHSAVSDSKRVVSPVDQKVVTRHKG